MKRYRFIARTAAVLCGVVALVVLVIALAMNSEAFSRWLTSVLVDRSGGALQIESVSGSLADTLRLENVVIGFDAGTASVESVEFELDWRSLLARSVVLDSLRLRQLRIVVAQGESPSGEPEPLELDLLVLIRRLEIDEAQFQVDESNYTIADVSLGLRLMRNRLEVEDVSARYSGLSVNGSAAATLTDTLDIETDFCLDGEFAQESVAACIDASGNEQEILIDAQLRSPFTAQGSGTVALLNDGPVSLNVSWQNAQLSSFDVAMSPEGSLQLTGTVARPRVVSNGSVVWLNEEALFSLQASMNETDVQVESLSLIHQSGSALLDGEVSRDFGIGQFEVELTDLDPAYWVPQWPGELYATASVGFSAQEDIRLNAADVVARGVLRGYPITAVGDLAYSDDVLSIDSLQVVSRTDRIVLAGTAGSELDLDVEAVIGDLAIAGDDFSGALTADLRIAGTPSQPLVRGEVGLTDFLSGGLTAQTLRITGNAGLAAEDPFDISVAGADVSAAGTPIDSVMFNVTGSAAAHRLDAQLTAEGWSSRLISDGAIADSDWRGRISEFEFVPSGLGFWRLRVPADVRYGLAGYSVSELCLTYELSSICGAVSVAGTTEDALDISAVNFDLSILEPFMPVGLQAKGLVNVNGSLTNFASDPRGRVELDAMDAQVDILLAENVSLPVPIAELAVAALLDDSGATLSARIDAAESGRAAAAIVIDEPLAENSPMQGSLNFVWEDASVFSVLSPDVEGLAGSLDAQLTIGGTVQEPILNGSANWSEGALEVPAWGLVVEQIGASVEASQSRDAVFSARGMVDSNPLEIDGTVLLNPDEGWPMRLALRGQDLSLVQLAEIEMRVTPDLEADVRLPLIEVTGNVAIPYARIRDVVLPEQAVVPSPDTVIHGLDSTDRGRPLEVIADLVLELGDDVTYEDANLNAAVTGALDLDYRSGQGAAAQGALTLTGQYDAYGNPLSLQRGQLIFVGPLADPSLDILAVREIGAVTAGVQLAGTLRTPRTTIYSVPAMSEADALSWLLFGRPLSGAQDADSGALRSAALSMGLQQALPVIERIGETLRLDDFAIRNTATDAGALMAGKYLSPKLYFRYSYGLFNRIGGLLIRYNIGDRFSLETRSGEHNSMDLLYTVEKD